MNNSNPRALQSYVDKYGITRYGTIGPNPGGPALLQYGPDGNLTPEAQAQFESGFNPSDYKPVTPGATPGIAPPGILTAEENTQIDAQYAAEQAASQQPALTQETPSQQPILSQQPPPVEQAPPGQEKEPWKMSLAEKMGRYGGNGLAAQGGRAAVGSMGSTTAEIYEAERAQNQQIEENEVARMGKTTTAGLEAIEQMRAMDETKSKFDNAIAGFIKYGDTVTGPIDSRYQAFKDKTGINLPGGAKPDPERAAFLLSLREIIVNDTLLKTAMTKGAISNAEMALFQQGIPNVEEMQEDVWIAWLTARRQNIEMIQNRIRNGTRVSLDSGVGFANAYTVPKSSSPVPEAPPSALTQAQQDAMTKNTPSK